MSSGLVAILVVGGLLLGVALAILWWVNRPTPLNRSYASETLPLFGSDSVIDARPIDSDEIYGDNQVAAGAQLDLGEAEAPTRAKVAAALAGTDSAIQDRRAVRFAPPPGTYPGPTSRVETRRHEYAGAKRNVSPIDVSEVEHSMFEGHSVRFSIPTDGTLQFLQGRLEITAGQDLGREIRFVRLPDLQGTRVTFGRLEGAMYRHVQLRDPTVSRMHASMQLTGHEWQLTNLSTTNPVVFNDQPLEEGESVDLTDGDRIEMGEVVFRFRER